MEHPHHSIQPNLLLLTLNPSLLWPARMFWLLPVFTTNLQHLLSTSSWPCNDFPSPFSRVTGSYTGCN